MNSMGISSTNPAILASKPLFSCRYRVRRKIKAKFEELKINTVRFVV